MFRTAMWIGLVALPLAIVLVVVLPTRMGPLPDGMRTPIVAFELARSSAEVEAMFGPPGSFERAASARAMGRGNAIDYAFMVAYGGYVVAFSRALRAAGSKSAGVGLVLGVVAVLADALENVQLLTITARLGGEYDGPLAMLAVLTWTKWGALAVALASWSPGLARQGAVGRVAAGAALATATFTGLAVVRRGIYAELMALGVAVTMISSVVIAVRRRSTP